MDAQTQAQLLQYVEEIGKILYAEAHQAHQADLKTFEGIETTVRSLSQEYVMPELCFFLSKQRQEQQPVKNEALIAPSEKYPSQPDKPNG